MTIRKYNIISGKNKNNKTLKNNYNLIGGGNQYFSQQYYGQHPQPQQQPEQPYPGQYPGQPYRRLNQGQYPHPQPQLYPGQYYGQYSLPQQPGQPYPEQYYGQPQQPVKRLLRLEPTKKNKKNLNQQVKEPLPEPARALAALAAPTPVSLTRAVKPGTLDRLNSIEEEPVPVAAAALPPSLLPPPYPLFAEANNSNTQSLINKINDMEKERLRIKESILKSQVNTKGPPNSNNLNYYPPLGSVTVKNSTKKSKKKSNQNRKQSELEKLDADIKYAKYKLIEMKFNDNIGVVLKAYDKHQLLPRSISVEQNKSSISYEKGYIIVYDKIKSTEDIFDRYLKTVILEKKEIKIYDSPIIFIEKLNDNIMKINKKKDQKVTIEISKDYNINLYVAFLEKEKSGKGKGNIVYKNFPDALIKINDIILDFTISLNDILIDKDSFVICIDAQNLVGSSLPLFHKIIDFINTLSMHFLNKKFVFIITIKNNIGPHNKNYEIIDASNNNKIVILNSECYDVNRMVIACETDDYMLIIIINFLRRVYGKYYHILLMSNDMFRWNKFGVGLHYLRPALESNILEIIDPTLQDLNQYTHKNIKKSTINMQKNRR